MAKNDKNAEKIATLKPKQELELLKIAKYGNGKQKEAALMSLIYYNQNLVKYIVRGYSYLQGQVDHEDLIAEGTIALAKAIEKFDVNSKNRFATYAGYWIRQYIQSFVHKDQLINQPTNQQKSKKEETTDEDSNIEEDSDEKKFIRPNFNILYYDKWYQNGDKDSKPYSLVDILSDKKDNIDDQIRKSDTKIHVNEILSLLEPLEDLIIRLYYGIIPINLNQIYHVGNEKEKQEIIKLLDLKSFRKKKIEEIRINEKEIKSNTTIKKYVKLFERPHKTKEISEIIGKAEGIVRKLKQKALKKMKILAEEKDLNNLL